MGRRGKRQARIASVSTPTRITVSLRFRARMFRFCRQRRSTDAISGNVTAGLGDSSVARFATGELYRSFDRPTKFGFCCGIAVCNSDSLRSVILSEPVSSLREATAALRMTRKRILFLTSARWRYPPQTWQQQMPSDSSPETRTEEAHKWVSKTKSQATPAGCGAPARRFHRRRATPRAAGWEELID